VTLKVAVGDAHNRRCSLLAGYRAREPFLQGHKAQQEAARQAAGELWQEYDVVFARPTAGRWTTRGSRNFQGGRDRRPPSVRRQPHTAGTILNELGVDMPTILEILRHTQISQTQRYVKGRSHLSKDAMRCMGEFFVPSQSSPPTPESGPH
jgi:hypothetical protein